MFDKRLMTMCPESKKYIAGNIICQWIELLMNAVMIYVVSNVIGKIYLVYFLFFVKTIKGESRNEEL